MRRLFLLLLALSGLFGCDKPAPNQIVPPANPLSVTKEVVIVTHNGPSTYYVDSNNEYAGFEYDLVKLFISDLGADYRVKFLLVNNISEVIPALLEGRAHIAAADLSVTHLRQHLVRFSKPYRNVQQLVIYNLDTLKRNNEKAPKKLQDLIGKQIIVPANTSYAERLGELKKSEAALSWKEVNTRNTSELIEEVAAGTVEYTIADDHLLGILKNLYPNLGADMKLGEPEKIAWAFPNSGNEWLYMKANDFLSRIEKDGTLRNLIDRYYGQTQRLEQVDVTAYLERSRTQLPKYAALFKQAQEITGLDWRLIAAIAYQESHWDPLNTSPTNVRGMMMLTEDTADRLGVTDRLDAKQSILAGARYMVMLRDQIPERIPEPDRTWMALAAYNIGVAHLEDARVLAQRMNLNPDRWADVKNTLPLLSKPEYYTTLKYGYASGGAPVVFVESIRSYYQILEKHEARHEETLPGFERGWKASRIKVKPL